MIYRFIILLAVSTFIACDDEYYGSNSDGPGETAYFIESEISLSPDREYLGHIITDTIFSRYSGIGRIQVGQPLREKILGGFNYRSPSIGFDYSIFAFLISGHISFYNFASDSGWQSTVTDSFETIVWVNPGQLLVGRNDTLHLVEKDNGISKSIFDYWDPSLVAQDTFICMATSDGLNYYIIKDNIGESSPEVLYTFRTAGYPRCPTIDIASGHIAYSIVVDSVAYICTAEVGQIMSPSEGPVIIDSSGYAKACIIDYNRILFTGPDGRIYQKDFYNTSEAIPFIQVEDNN